MSSLAEEAVGRYPQILADIIDIEESSREIIRSPAAYELATGELCETARSIYET